jgi:hypothetical protein
MDSQPTTTPPLALPLLIHAQLHTRSALHAAQHLPTAYALPRAAHNNKSREPSIPSWGHRQRVHTARRVWRRLLFTQTRTPKQHTHAAPSPLIAAAAAAAAAAAN